MAYTYKSNRVITWWMIVSSVVVIWDASFCLMRPRSFPGGDLHWLWKPYAKYIEVDYVYGIKAYENKDGFTNAQSVMNLVESALNFLYVYYANVVDHPAAPLFGIIGTSCTLSKTILYWLQEYYSGYSKVGHNSLPDLLLYFVLPNALWLAFPAYALWVFSKHVWTALQVAPVASPVGKAAKRKSK